MAAICEDNRIDVPHVLNQDQIRGWIDDGYLIIPDMLSSAELDELKQDLVAIARGKYPSENFKPLPNDISAEDAIANILAIHHPHLISPVIVKYAKHPKIVGALSQIVGSHLPWWDGSVKCMQTMLFVKPPGFQGQAWHQDELYIQTRDRSLTGVWIAMDDANEENGCLRVIPGSHKVGYLYPQHNHDDPNEFDGNEMSYGFDESSAISVVVKAGSVVFFQGHLLHCSQKNRSDRFRRTLVIHTMNAWSILPWSNPDLPVPSTGDRRAIIPLSGIDPYAWKGIVEHHRTPYLRRCSANTKALPPQASMEDKK